MASSTSPLAAEAWRTATIASRAANLHNLAAWRNSTPVFGKPYLANLFGQNHLAKLIWQNSFGKIYTDCGRRLAGSLAKDRAVRRQVPPGEGIRGPRRS